MKTSIKTKLMQRAAARLLLRARAEYFKAIRTALRTRSRRTCDDPKCPGYVVAVVDRFPGVEIETCDACAPKGLTDTDVAALPEAQKLLREHPASQD